MEFIDGIGELKALPEGIHLLCPRQNDDDYGRYEDLDQVDEKGIPIKDIVAQAQTRKETFLSSMRILAYHKDGVEELQNWVLGKLDDSLEKCDLCIKHYYTGKIWLVDRLKDENYQEEDIEAFAQRIDEWDIKRITRNLGTATEQLRNTPPQKIGLDVLDRAALLSIFETLSCEAMLRSESLLQQHFDEPFKLIQTKRSLKVSDYIPAVTRFLFDSNQLRCFWAHTSWARYTRPPTTTEFEWAIRDGLRSALQTASQQPPQLPVIARLWRGMQPVIRKLDKEQITHQLRALEIDPCRLSVDHLAIPSPGLRYLLNTIQLLLEKAPADFWDAMQTISPQAIMEHTFYNTQFNSYLMATTDGEPFEKSPLKDMLSWIHPFLSSLKGAHQPSACRFLTLQLLGRLQDPQFPNLARYHCFHVGLTSLLQTLRRFTDNESSRGSVTRVVLAETMGVVSDTINTIINPPTFAVEQSRQQEILNLCMDVVRNTLALECQSLKTDYEVILKHNTLSHGVSTYSAPIWDAVIKNLNQANLPLSGSALLGILPLVGLEKFTTQGENNPEKTHFNMIYEHLINLSCRIIGRLADFPPEHLEKLFQSQDTSSAMISALFAADLNTYTAAVDLIKNATGQSARRDAISHLLQSSFTTTVYGLSWSFRRISTMKTFAPAPRMLYTGTDIVETLCDSQHGILRTRNLADRREVVALQKLWEYLWSALTTIFDETESWHVRGNDKSVMLEFCRDTIQFADFLFNQYGVFLGAVSNADPGQTSASENFLKSPTATMSAMVKWLRLKDEFLASTLVGIVSKILRRLGGMNVTDVKDDALKFIEGVAVDAKIKTILNQREKAELVRSLEAYYKKPVVTASTAALKKQSSIMSFAKPSDTLGSSHATSDDEFDDDLNDQTLLELSSSVEVNKARVAAEGKRKAEQAAKARMITGLKSRPAPPKPMITPRPKDDATSVLSFREKREREKEAKKKRDAEQLAKLKKGMSASGVGEQTAEQGSGLKGIGIKGKDHAIPADSMMVSSGSESDSDSEDDLDTELFGGAKPKKPDAVAAYELSKKQSLQQQPIKKVKRHRSIRDMRARLSPDLSSLHHSILSWEFFASGDGPPSSDRTDYSLVSNTFRTPLDYQSTFQPLLVLEAWQGFQAAKEEGSFRPFEVKVMTRLAVDTWIEFSTQPLGIPPKDFSMGEGDLVLFSTSSKPTSDQSAPHILARVCGVNRKGGKMEVTYRVNPSNNKFLSNFGPGTETWAAKITSLTPVEREYGALMALQYYDLCEEIVLAKPSPILNYSDARLQSIMDNYTINRAQARAIKSAVDNDAFTLIQGPPGSGKTKTITALVGSLLTNVLGKQAVSISSGAAAARNTMSKKLLLCAPSNAAVDELVMRLKDGVKTSNGRKEKVSVLRLGRSDAINTKVLDVTLDHMVTARLSQDTSKGDNVDMQKLYDEHKKTDSSFKELRGRLDEARAKGLPPPEELEREFELMKKKRSQLSTSIDKARDQNHTFARNADMRKRRIQEEIINESHVICTTLSGSGHDIFQSINVEFETVIIDEAAQCIELSALIPLKYGCSKCVLVGDPKQLPPTVLSKMASKFQYEQSLFVRMQKNHPKDVHLLDTQYRMHPDISSFPSQTFYDGKLEDGPDMAKLRRRPWHQSDLLSPYRFFDVQGMHSAATKGHSLINYAELQVAMQLYDRLITDVKEYNFAGKIGIITPYKGQLRELKNHFSHRYGEDILNKIDFNTTDAFQGRESEVIIFSCVRASNKGIGFLADIRRMNVGLTRAKSSLWVLGNSRSLVQGEFWNKLITNARERNVYTEGDILQILQKPQFTGYKEVEMLDIDAEDSSVTHGKEGTDNEASVPPLSRPSSAASIDVNSRPASSVSTPVPSAPPMPLPSGPSGGNKGLDETKVCGVCGSAKHFTHNCDNDDAKLDARGNCFRCGNPGHTKNACRAERCLECGQCGHLASSCTNPKTLSKFARTRIEREEYNLQQRQIAFNDRKRERQMGGHNPKVPVVQSTASNASKKPVDESAKRKRGDSASEAPQPQRPRTASSNAPSHAPKGPRGHPGLAGHPGLSGPSRGQSRGPSGPIVPSHPGLSGPPIQAPKGPKGSLSGNKAPSNAPKGPATNGPPEGLIKPSRDGPAYPIENKPSSIPTEPRANAPNQVAPKPRPPMRKKKEADPFIRPKARRK